MKRTIKNVITAALIIGMSGGIYFTYTKAKESITPTMSMNMQMPSGDMQGQSGDSTTPPEMPSNDSNSNTQGQPSGDQQNQNGDSTTPPEKPSGESDSGDSTTPPEMPSGDTTEQTNGDSTTPPQMPSGDTTGQTNGDSTTPPEMPSGDNNSSDSSNGMPTNGNQSQQMGQVPSGDMQMTVEDTELSVQYYVIFACEGAVVSAALIYLLLSKFNKKSFKQTFEATDKVLIELLSVILITGCLTYGMTKLTTANASTTTEQPQMQMDSQSSKASVSSSAVTTISEDTEITSGEYESTNSDENTIKVDGCTADLSNITVTKSGDSDGGDNTSFYGTNSAILACNGAILNLDSITVNTDATGANGVFCYGGSATTNNSSSDGTTVNISNSTITTTQDNSGGIMTTGGGTTNVTNCTVTTNGTSSAAIRTDRGGGTVTVDEGTYTTNGQGSPSIYSTADVTVSNASLVSNVSEGVVIEGANSVTLDNCTLDDSNTKLNGQSTTYKNIFLYQSMSGDADSGEASFSAKNCTITTNNGDSFYVTNTTASITLENNTIVNNDADGNFLRIQKDSWGNEGSNGGSVTLTLNKQEVEGNIVVDSISTLDMIMKNSSSYKGTINADNTAKSITLTLSSDSTITLTGDSYVTSLEDADSTYSNIDLNGYTLYVNGVALSK